MRIAVINDSNTEKLAKYYQARLLIVKSLPSAVPDWHNKQVDGVIYSY